MASLRVFVIILLFANLLALSLWKGWLGGELHHGEPERLSNQLNPGGIRLVGEESRLPVRRVPVAPPPAAVIESKVEEAPAQEVVPPQACVIFSGLSADQARELSARIAKAGSGFKMSEGRSEAPSSWWVHIPSQGSKDAADKKAAELRKLGITDLFIMQEAGPAQFAISLGLYKSEAAASRQLEALKEKGVRSAQLLARGGGVSRLEVRGPSDSLSTVVSDLSERLRGVNRLECTP